MDLNARDDVNCRRKDGRTKNRMPISHLAKAGATINNLKGKLSKYNSKKLNAKL